MLTQSSQFNLGVCVDIPSGISDPNERDSNANQALCYSNHSCGVTSCFGVFTR